MGLTRLDCNIYRGPGASIDTSAFTVLNPGRRPGSLVIASSSAIREGIGSQVACRLSLDHFVGGVLAFYDRSGAAGEAAEGAKDEISVEVLEAAFKNANTSVYDFGHKLAAGGRMAASLLGLVVEGDVVAAGRAGGGSAYLYRGGELFPFFERRDDLKEDSFVGSQSLVTVELASVPIEESDRLLVFSRVIDEVEEDKLSQVLRDSPKEFSESVENIVTAIFRDTHELGFSMSAQLGPRAILLRDAVKSADRMQTVA